MGTTARDFTRNFRRLRAIAARAARESLVTSNTRRFREIRGLMVRTH